MRADVIDISHYQTVTDGFAGAKQLGIRGVIAKASEGHTLRDDKFFNFRAQARTAGLLFGAYHFIRHGDPVGQADFFLKTVGNVDGLCLVLDWEDAKVTPEEAYQFARRIYDKTGGYPVLYTYSAFLRERESVMLKYRTFWRGCKLWIAQYGPKVTMPTNIWLTWWLWQFTGDGAGLSPHDVIGVGKKIDINTFNGISPATLGMTWATLPKAPGITVPVPEVPPGTPEKKNWFTEVLRNFFRKS